MKSLTKSFFLISVMLHLFVFVNSFDTSLKTKTPPSSKILEPYRVYITDVDVNSIIYQCNVPGPMLLRSGETFTWKFRRNFFDSNRYNCWFGWLQEETQHLKTISINVFDKEVAQMCGRNLFAMNRCYWLITQSGMYFSKRNETFLFHSDDNWRYMYAWN